MYAHTHRHRHPGRIGERETTAIPSSPQLRKLLVKKKNLTLQFNGPRGLQSSPLKGAIQVQAADMPLGLLWMRVGIGSRGSVGSGAPTLHTSSQDSSMLTCLMLSGCQIDLERGSSAIISFKETLWSGARQGLSGQLSPRARGAVTCNHANRTTTRRAGGRPSDSSREKLEDVRRRSPKGSVKSRRPLPPPQMPSRHPLNGTVDILKEGQQVSQKSSDRVTPGRNPCGEEP